MPLAAETPGVRTTGPPVLVTGAPRSGTTILGRLLAAPRHVAMVYEPFNLHIGLRDIPRQFVYVSTGTTDEPVVEAAVEALLAGRGTFRPSGIPGHTPGPVKRLLRRALVSRTSVDYRLAAHDPRRTRWLLKDPLAGFSAEWLARRFGMSVVVIVRHPAATVASYLRLGWRFSLTELQQQPELMRDHLEPVLSDVDAGRLTAVEEGALLWRSYYEVLGRYLDRNPGMTVVRHEDLSREPLVVLGALYRHLGLRLDDRIARRVRAYTGAHNRAGPAPGAVQTLRRNSMESIDVWRLALSPEDAARIRQLAGPVGARWYADPDDWSTSVP